MMQQFPTGGKTKQLSRLLKPQQRTSPKGLDNTQESNYPIDTSQASLSNYLTERQKTIDWLLENKYPPIPVAPAQDPYKHHKVSTDKKTGVKYCPLTSDLKPVPLYTGKNPSYLDRGGKPHLLNHRKYQNQLPTKQERKDWFANPLNGIGTLGGWNDTYWSDLDNKQFESQSECDRAFHLSLERQPGLRHSYLEKTQSGGYRIAVKCKKKPDFTNFALWEGGPHVGELLGAGRFTVLAPTVGVSGNPYLSINRAVPVEVDEIDFVYPTKTASPATEAGSKVKENQAQHELLLSEWIPGSINLDLLLNQTAQNILAGNNVKGDRSDSLTTLINEAWGWFYWCQDNGISVTGTVEELAHYAGAQLGIDSDRVERILQGINADISLQPAAHFKGGDSPCWKKIYRLDQATFEVKCPAQLKNSIKNEWGGFKQPNQGGGGNYKPPGSGGGDDNGGDNGSKPERNHWNAPSPWNGELGWWVEDKKGKVNHSADSDADALRRKFIPQTNFDFQIERELSDDSGGGLVIQCKRSVDNYQKRIIIASKDYTEASTFVNAIKQAYGAGVVCNLKKQAIGALIHVRLMEYHDRNGKLYKLATRHGQQEDGTWVFSSRQFTKDGNPTSENSSKIVFNPNLGDENAKMPSPQIAPPDEKALPRLVEAMRRFHGESQIEVALLTLGWVAAGVHYQSIMKQEGRFPGLVLVGDPGSGKSVMAQNGLSLVGWRGELGMFSQTSVSAMYENLKLSGSLPLCYDDPERTKEIDELFKRLYNGKSRNVRNNTQTPHAPMMATANHNLGDDNLAVWSRLVQLYIHRSDDGDSDAWDDLVEAQRLSSGAFPQLIALGYPAAEVRKLAKELRKHLPHAHPRIGDSLALILWYGQAVARLAGFEEKRLFNYVVNVLCKQANDADSAADSLFDFLDKLHALHSQSLIGEWDTRLVETSEMGLAVAVVMPSVWSSLDFHFNPPYSRRVIESLIVKAGGQLKSVQKFHRSSDESKAYYRALISPRIDSDGGIIPPREPDCISRRCVLIPGSIAADFIKSWRNREPTPGEGGGSTLTPGSGGERTPSEPTHNESTFEGSVTSVTSGYSQLHEKCNQQNPEPEHLSGSTSVLVTSFEKEEGELISGSVESSSSGDGDGTPLSDSKNQIGYTLTLKKNVTEEILSSETKTQRESQRLQGGGNQDVTDVTSEPQIVTEASPAPMSALVEECLNEAIDTEPTPHLQRVRDGILPGTD